MHVAAITGQTAMFEKIIESEVNKNPVNEIGRTAFHVACKYGQTSIVEKMIDNAERLNLDLTVKDNDGRTAFHDACHHGKTSIVEKMKDNEEKLSKIYEEIDGFDHKSFIDGSKKAFEVILTAYNKGDKKTLKPLVSKDVFATFENAIEQNLNNKNAQFFSLVVVFS